MTRFRSRIHIRMSLKIMTRFANVNVMIATITSEAMSGSVEGKVRERERKDSGVEQVVYAVKREEGRTSNGR